MSMRHRALSVIFLSSCLVGCSKTVTGGFATRADVVVCFRSSASPGDIDSFVNDRFFAKKVSTTPVRSFLSGPRSFALNWATGADTDGRQAMISALRREPVVEAVHENSNMAKACGSH